MVLDLQGSVSSAVTLLVPQSSTSLLGHAAISCPAADPAKGLTCGDVLAAIHGFYQQDVLLKPSCMQQDISGATPACQTGWQHSPAREAARGCQDSEELTGHGAGCGAGSSEQQQKSSRTAPAEAAGAKWSGLGGVQVIKRLQLLGHRQMFEGLFRVTRDPCSTVYEVCLA